MYRGLKEEDYARDRGIYYLLRTNDHWVDKFEIEVWCIFTLPPVIRDGPEQLPKALGRKVILFSPYKPRRKKTLHSHLCVIV